MGRGRHIFWKGVVNEERIEENVKNEKGAGRKEEGRAEERKAERKPSPIHHHHIFSFPIISSQIKIDGNSTNVRIGRSATQNEMK